MLRPPCVQSAFVTKLGSFRTRTPSSASRCAVQAADPLWVVVSALGTQALMPVRNLPGLGPSDAATLFLEAVRRKTSSALTDPGSGFTGRETLDRGATRTSPRRKRHRVLSRDPAGIRRRSTSCRTRSSRRADNPPRMGHSPHRRWPSDSDGTRTAGVARVPLCGDRGGSTFQVYGPERRRAGILT